MTDNNEEIRRALDLDNWDEAHGFIDLEKMLCPHCKADNTISEAITSPRQFRCAGCKKPFVCQMIETPLGPGYSTRSPFKSRGKAAPPSGTRSECDIPY